MSELCKKGKAAGRKVRAEKKKRKKKKEEN